MGKKIRVAQVIAGTDVAGAKGYTIQLVGLADKSRFDTCMINPLEGMTTKEARMAGIEPYVIKQNPSVLAKLMKDLDLDIIHTHGVRANFLGRIASKMTGIPNVCTMHSDSRLDYDSSLKERMVWWMDNMMNSSVSAFIGVSTDMSENLVKRGIPREKIVTVRNGINIDAVTSSANPEETKKKYGINPKLRLIGTVGRLVEVKGHADMVDILPKILQKVPDAAMIIIGDGRCLEPLRKQAEELQITDRVILPGRIKDPYDLMSACEIGCFPSHAEAIGLALLEFMALKVPTVAYQVGGIPEVITNPEQGVLVPPKDKKSLAEAIIDLMGNEQKKKKMGEMGRARVLEEFTTKRMLEETEKVWERFARKR